MNKLKQIFSPENISANLQRSLRRFPVALVMLTLLTGFLSYTVLVNDMPEYGFVTIFYLSVGIVLDFAVSLWGDEQTNRKRYYIVKGVSLGIWTIYCVWLYCHQKELLGKDNMPFLLANTAWITALVLGIPFVSFRREENDVQAWHLSVSLCKAILISALITGIFAIGLNALIAGTSALFDLDPSKETYAVTNIVCAMMLSGLLFFNLVPAGERKHNASTDMPRFLTNVVKWLLLPLLACYMLVLYVYSCTIIAKWELPKGLISWLVSAVMGGYLLGYVILYPQLLDAKAWLTKLFTRWLPALIMPLLVLMTVGVVRRFSDYGVTAPRLYLVTLLVWYYAVCLLIIALPRKRLHWIFLSVAALFVLSSGHPLNYYRICEKVIQGKVEALLAIEQTQRTVEQQADLIEHLRYMRRTYGTESVEAYGADSILMCNYYKYDYYKRKPDLDSTWCIDYRYYRTLRCPQGQFATFRSKDYYKTQGATVTDGMLNIPMVIDRWSEQEIFLLDTAEVRQAKRDTAQLFISSRSGRYVYVPARISIDPEPYDSIYIRIDGYLFGK